jgi:signal transduction histidine kinase
MRRPFRRADARAEDGHPGPVLRRAVRRFAVASLLALLVVALGSVVMSRRIAQEEAVRDATVSAVRLARSLVAPRMDPGLWAGQPEAQARMTRLMRLGDGIGGESVAHVKIWDRSGRVIWADDHALIGKRFVLPSAVIALFGTSGSVAELPDSDNPRHGGVVGENDLLEVYAGAVDADGRPFVLETFTPRSRLAHNTQVIFVELLPIGIAALLLFSLVTAPVAVSLARHVDRGHRHRTELLRHSLAAWDLERRRLAEDLHDGAVQQLAAVGYALAVVVEKLPDAESRETGRRLTELVVGAVTSVREIVGSLVPSELADEGLAGAIADLASSTREEGLEVVVDVDPDVCVDRDIARIAYRVTREGLRNVVKHAGASTARVTVRPGDDGRVDVRVSDDGRGLPAGPPDADRHMGLDLLAATVREVGGDLALEEDPDGGLVLAASLPAEVDG